MVENAPRSRFAYFFGACAFALAFLAVGLPSRAASASLWELHLMGGDGVGLGIVDCTSIGNRASRYGSPVGDRSVWNVVGKYGSIVSDYSAYNVIAEHPPALFDISGNLVGYVTMNAIKFPRVSPKRLEAFLMDRCDQDEDYREGE